MVDALTADNGAALSLQIHHCDMILTFGDEPLTNTVSTLCPRCFATTPRRLLLGKAVLNVQVKIEQLGDFASGAWFPNLVQCSQNVLAETTIRIRNLLHRTFQGLEELTKPSPAMSASALQGNANRYVRSSRARGQQLNKHVPYSLRLVLSSIANQSVRTFESPGSFHFHFPVVICTRPDN